MPTLAAHRPAAADQAVKAAAAGLYALGISASLHSLPYGSAVDPCVWCDLTDPEAAVVQFTAAVPDACLGCAATAGQHAIEAADTTFDAERIRADVYAVECPSILSEADPEPEIPGRVTVTDSEGRQLAVDTVGIEVHLVNPNTFRSPLYAVLDLSTPAGRSAVTALRDALDQALAGAA